MSLRFALTVEEAAAMLGVSTGTVYRMIKRGDLPAEKLGPQRMVIPARALVERFGEPVEVAA